MRVLETFYLTTAFEMPTIDQVSKRVFSDRNWLQKCGIGLVLCIIPIFVLGYLYQIFAAGKQGKELVLPEWEDFKTLALDGLITLVIVLIFTGLPLVLVWACSSFAFDWPFAKIPLIPVMFLVGPLSCAALYLYMVKKSLADCFNLDALMLMLKGAAASYTVPTFAFIGLIWITWPMLPLSIVFGGIFYFYLMGYAFRDLQHSTKR